MACTFPQQIFNEDSSLEVSINVSGTTATLILHNKGHNVLALRRILLGVTSPSGGASVLFLRPPGELIPWSFTGANLEQGSIGTFFTLTGLQPGAVVEAQAEYIEVQDRSRSCQFTV